MSRMPDGEPHDGFSSLWWFGAFQHMRNEILRLHAFNDATGTAAPSFEAVARGALAEYVQRKFTREWLRNLNDFCRAMPPRDEALQMWMDMEGAKR